jgi:hypothetical protein
MISLLLRASILLLFQFSYSFSGEIEGIYQTETESEFEIRLNINSKDSGIIEWRAKDLKNNTAICSTWTFHWTIYSDTMRIDIPNEKCNYNVELFKDYKGNIIMMLKPFEIKNKRSFLEYRFYKFGTIKRFKEYWESFNCQNNKTNIIKK